MKTLRALLLAFVLCLAFAPVEFEGVATAGEVTAAYAADLSPATAPTIYAAPVATIGYRLEAIATATWPGPLNDASARTYDGDLSERLGGFDVLKEPRLRGT